WSGLDKKSIDDIERCISITRGIIETLEEKKIPYGFITNAIMSGLPAERNMIYPSAGQVQLNNLLEYLGRMSYNISISFEDLILTMNKKDIHCSTYIIITPKILDSYIDFINSIASEMTRVIIISLSRDNLECLSENIIKYVEKRDDEYTLSQTDR
ncbi:MAG: DUF58 domain-containing protein, partial [bacterium]